MSASQVEVYKKLQGNSVWRVSFVAAFFVCVSWFTIQPVFATTVIFDPGPTGTDSNNIDTQEIAGLVGQELDGSVITLDYVFSDMKHVEFLPSIDQNIVMSVLLTPVAIRGPSLVRHRAAITATTRERTSMTPTLRASTIPKTTQL